MPRKTALPDDDALKLEARAKLIDVMRNAGKLQYVDITCKHCERRQRIQALVPDNTNVVKAAGEIIDRLEGKAATRRETPKVNTAGRSLEELTDEELEAMISGGTDGTPDGGAAEEAA
jgi:hypothetical protein